MFPSETSVKLPLASISTFVHTNAAGARSANVGDNSPRVRGAFVGEARMSG
jgi:hypothetical protein